MEPAPAPVKTHCKLLTSPNYIGSYTLMIDENTSREIVVKIIKAEQGEVQNGDKKEPALLLQLKDQLPMIINATNRKAIVKATGSSFIEDWEGKLITLYTSKIMAFGEMHHALRIRTTLAVVALPGLTPESKHLAGAITALSKGNTTIEKIKKTMSISPENEATLISLSIPAPVKNDTSK